MVYWIRHWTDKLKDPSSNPSTAIREKTYFWRKFLFFLSFSKNKFLAQETSTSQTHFGFTNLGSGMPTLRDRANWKSKFWFGSPCMYIWSHNFCIWHNSSFFFQNVIVLDLGQEVSNATTSPSTSSTPLMTSTTPSNNVRSHLKNWFYLIFDLIFDFLGTVWYFTNDRNHEWRRSCWATARTNSTTTSSRNKKH